MAPQEWLAQQRSGQQPQGNNQEVAAQSPQEWLSKHRATNSQPKETSWGEAATGAAENFIPSVGNVIKGVAGMVAHPVDTAQGALDVANGAMRKVLPDSINSLMPDSTKGNEQKADAVGELYKDRYGTTEGFKQTLKNDPASIMMDASMLAGGVGVAAKAGGLARVAEIANKAAVVTNPLYLPAKGVQVAANVLPKAAEFVVNKSGLSAESLAIDAAKKAWLTTQYQK